MKKQRLVDANALILDLLHLGDLEFDAIGVANFISHAPVVDAAEVRYAHWEFPVFKDSDVNDPRAKCSECGSIEIPLIHHKYCPVCGALMKE